MQLLHIVHWKKSGIYGVAENLKNVGSTVGDEHNIFCLRYEKSFLDFVRMPLRIIHLMYIILVNRSAILHAHSFFPCVLIMPFLWRKRALTIHNDYPFFTYNNFRSRVKKKAFLQLIESDAEASCVSESVQSSFEMATGSTVEVIYNPVPIPVGVDIKLFSSPKNIKSFASLGRLDNQKNYGNLVCSLEKVDKDIKVRVAGSGVLESELKKLVTKLAIADKIDFVGFIEEPVRFLSQSDAYICSSHYEGCPLSVIEAMLCRRLVVSTNVGYLNKESDFSYISVEPSADSLAKGILEATSLSANRVSEMTDKNYHLAKRLFDPLNIYRKFTKRMWSS